MLLSHPCRFTLGWGWVGILFVSLSPMVVCRLWNQVPRYSALNTDIAGRLYRPSPGSEPA